MKPTGISNDLRHAAGGLAVAAALATFGVLVPTMVSAQMYDQSWNFKPRDRAGLAVVMKQAESEMFDRSSTTGGSMGSASSPFLVDRKHDVSGQDVSVRVNLGARRTLKKKNK